MNNKVIYNVSLSAKQLSDFSGKSVNTCKKFLRDLTTNLTANLTAESKADKKVEPNPVTADLTPNLTPSKDEQYVEPVYDWQQMVDRKVETPTPVEPPVYPETPKPKFDFAQIASQSLQDNNPETKSDYWKRLRASMGDTDC